MNCVPPVADLVRQLRAFHGYRTLWLDPTRTTVLHAEPDEELEALGYRYLATVMRPDPDTLVRALQRGGLPVGHAPASDSPRPAWPEPPLPVCTPEATPA